MYMPITQIKYNITSKRALKPDTFKEYLTCKFVLNELPEAEAKKMANSFIDELGRKYDKINHGCTYTEYDTAMHCWTSATNDKRTFLLITMMTCI